MNDSLCYIIIVNYNSSSNTINCINSILESTYSNFQIILVDNYSTDDSLNSLKTFYSNIDKITIIKSDKNGGYGYGVNIGLKHSILKKDCRYIWVLNNDTIIFNNTLEEFVSAEINSKNLKIWGSKVLNKDFTIQSLGCRINKYFMTTKHNYNGFKDICYDKSKYKIDYIHGCSMFFNKDVVNRVGLFDENYFLFYEDVDYSMQSKRNNISLDICNKSKIIHKENSTIKKMNYEFYSTSNRLKIAKKYFSNKLLFVYIGIFFELIKNIFLLRLNRNYLILKEIIYEF